MSQPSSILVLNGGSSSIKFSVYGFAERPSLLCEGEASGIGTPEAKFNVRVPGRVERPAPAAEPPASFPQAVRQIAAALDQPGLPRPSAIGHRVVHAGPNLTAHQRITDQVLQEIERATVFAPLHQPIALAIIQEAQRHFAGVENYACFDTVFHQSQPEVTSTYALPEAIRKRGVRRYGFHGLSCESVLQQFAEGRAPGLSASAKEIPARLIIAHLGSGASITAVRHGASLDTTMGLTPCGGILMGTRPGDLDPGLIFYLLRQHAGNSANPVDAIEQLLNRHSGMLALSGLSNDMRALRQAAEQGEPRAALAIQAFVLSAKKAIGGFLAEMSGAEALVFTGGIGEHDMRSRAEICAGLDSFGVVLDMRKNSVHSADARPISRQDSRTAIYVLPAEEDRAIARHVLRMAGGMGAEGRDTTPGLAKTPSPDR